MTWNFLVPPRELGISNEDFIQISKKCVAHASVAQRPPKLQANKGNICFLMYLPESKDCMGWCECVYVCAAAVSSGELEATKYTFAKSLRRQSLATSLSAYIIYSTQTSKHKCEKCWNSTKQKNMKQSNHNSICVRRLTKKMRLARRCSYELRTIEATHIFDLFFSTRWRHRVFGYPFSAVVLFMSLRFSRAPFQFENNFTHRKWWHYTALLVSTNLERFVSFWPLSLVTWKCWKVFVVKQNKATWRTTRRSAIKCRASIIMNSHSERKE